MNALEKAAQSVGGRSKLAELLGVTPMAISHWIKKSRRVSAERAISIEKATKGHVRRNDLRPDLFGPLD